MTFELDKEFARGASMKVVGVGGAGGNAIDRMISASLSGVNFVATNTDAQALDRSLAQQKVQIGSKITLGLGAGANPEIGKRAMEEDRDLMHSALTGSDMVFITAGMGGGTGTGAAPIIADIAKEQGALTVAVVTKPFEFEGCKRMNQAEEGLRELKERVDTLIAIPNQRLLSIVEKTTPLLDAFRLADEVLLHATRGISDLVTIPGLINLDFADVRTIMSEMGDALMGTGAASGEARAREAAQAAISSPLLEEVSIVGAQGLLVNITGGKDLALMEVNEAVSVIYEAAGPDANVIFGAVIDERSEGEVRVTVIATGLNPSNNMTPRRPTDKVVDFLNPKLSDLDRPAFLRREQSISPQVDAEPPPADSDDLSIPTFLRK
jgi:cell division protein FtsZ